MERDGGLGGFKGMDIMQGANKMRDKVTDKERE